MLWMGAKPEDSPWRCAIDWAVMDTYIPGGPDFSALLRTDQEVLRRIDYLVDQDARRARSLWLMFLSGEGMQLPTVVPIDDVPEHPDLQDVENLCGMIADVLMRAAPGGSAVVTLTRSGSETVDDTDRYWFRALHGAARERGAPIRMLAWRPRPESASSPSTTRADQIPGERPGGRRRLGYGRRGPNETGDRIVGGEPAQVGQREECFRADHGGEIILELSEPIGIRGAQCVAQRSQGPVDQPEPDTRATGGRLGAGDGGRDRGPDPSLVGQHATQQELAGEGDALDGIAGVCDRGERLGRTGPHAGEGFIQ